jgi:hypothetical protein
LANEDLHRQCRVTDASGPGAAATRPGATAIAEQTRPLGWGRRLSKIAHVMHEVKSRTRGRALLCGQDRHSVVGCIARQSERPQPCGLFANGMPVCFAFGHCILALPQTLFLLLEKRFGPIKSLIGFHAQRRNSFRGKPVERMFLLTGCCTPNGSQPGRLPSRSAQARATAKVLGAPDPGIVAQPWAATKEA